MQRQSNVSAYLAMSFPVVVGAVGVLAGCTGQLNRYDAPAGESLPDLESRMPAATAPSEPRGFAPIADRATWEKTTIVVETRQVETQPEYVSPPHYDTATARKRGDYPTTATVFQENGDGGAMAIEAVAAPFHSAWDLLVWPVRMCIAPPWTTVRRPLAPPSLEAPAAVPEPAASNAAAADPAGAAPAQP